MLLRELPPLLSELREEDVALGALRSLPLSPQVKHTHLLIHTHTLAHALRSLPLSPQVKHTHTSPTP